MTKQRVCMVFDLELLKQLRNIQGKKIQEQKRQVSFSQVVMDMIKIGMKNGDHRFE